MTLSGLLLEKRIELDLSLRDAAKNIGISHSYLDKLEKGFDAATNTANKPTPDTLRLISTFYNLDYNYLMALCGYIDEPTEEVSDPEIRVIQRAKRNSPEDYKKFLEIAKIAFGEDVFKNDRR